MKKYELLMDQSIRVLGKKLFRIRALVSFSDVEKGEIGGYIEKEYNLNQFDNSWVYGNAKVYDEAQVYGDAQVYDNVQVYGNACVSGNACVYGNAWVSGDAQVSGNACVYGNVWVSGNACVSGNAQVYAFRHIFSAGPIGSRHDTITFFRTKELYIAVKIGCFTGTITEFRKKVTRTHGDTMFGKTYQLLADVAEQWIDLEQENENE